MVEHWPSMHQALDSLSSTNVREMAGVPYFLREKIDYLKDLIRCVNGKK